MLIYDIKFSELTARLESWGEPKYRAEQIWDGIYLHYYSSFEEFSSLPKSLIAKLSETFTFEVLRPLDKLVSSDGKTIKTLFQLKDGLSVESVLMYYTRRNTICISTQVGCAMGCLFCATGQMGFKRHLSIGEIVAQVIYYSRELSFLGKSLTNIVIMGMGEPFHNYKNTLGAIDILNDPNGYNFGARRITISTVGLIPAIRKFTQEKRQVNLAISLHAAEDRLRSSMLPINKKFPIDDLFNVCREYTQATHRRITFEWALVEGVNDTPDQARMLAKRLKGMLCHVNAIPLNPTTAFNGKATPLQKAIQFRDTLIREGIPCTVRIGRGIDIQAGCGQLAMKGTGSDD